MDSHATIIAVASPPGRSLRGIIRVSGAEAFALIQPHLGMRSLPARGAFAATLKLSTSAPLSVWAFAFPAPHSYTGDDSIELHLPGNPALLTRVIDDLIRSGAAHRLDVRRAEPGEFTARAFLNAKIGLTQAEGVAATIAAQSDAELAAARMLTAGRLGDFARTLADDLASALALVEAGIDFTDQDDVVAIAPDALHDRLTMIRQRLRQQLDRSVGIEQLRAIPWVVLVGGPNAGKSALFNTLLGHERAVVSSIAGTTRDVLAEPLTIDTAHGQAEVMLVDLAGLDADDPTAMNALMQTAARTAIDRAELRLRCIPCDNSAAGSTPSRAIEEVDEIVIHTKSDLASPNSVCGGAPDHVAVSAVSGAGLADLRLAIAKRLASRAVSLAAGALALQSRHESAMRSALEGIEQALAQVTPQRSHRKLANLELIAASMRAALNDLASLAGEMTPDDILGRIFASFCIGK